MEQATKDKILGMSVIVLGSFVFAAAITGLEQAGTPQQFLWFAVSFAALLYISFSVGKMIGVGMNTILEADGEARQR